MKNTKNKIRSSNIELFRIVMILVVIGHHYVVNSGITNILDSTTISPKMIGMQIFGGGGKIAIDCFLLITGYFMCESNATLLKWLKLFVKYAFYVILINSIFLVFNYAPLGEYSLKYGFVPFIKNIATGYDSYVALFLVLFLLIPFLNKLIGALNRKEYLILISILLFVYSILSTFFFQIGEDGVWFVRNNFEGLGWYATVYLIGGFIRKYLTAKIDNLKMGIIMSILSIFIDCMSIIIFNHMEKISYYHFINSANKFMAITTAVSLFILFKNIRLPYVKFINTCASATFGVLLIHANSDTMRYFLWRDIIKATEQYMQGGAILFVKASISVLIIYIVCVCIELLVDFILRKTIFDRLKKYNSLTKPLYK